MSLYDEQNKSATMGQIVYLSTLTRPYPEKDYEGNVEKNNNNYYPGARACARVREESEAVAELYAYYCDTFDRPRVAPAVRRDIHDALEKGAEPSLIIYAMDIASAAPTPAWAYARAVIRQCMADDCHTYADCEARAERHSARKKTMRTGATAPERKAPDYMQRDLTDADMNSIFVDPMARRREH